MSPRPSSRYRDAAGIVGGALLTVALFVASTNPGAAILTVLLTILAVLLILPSAMIVMSSTWGTVQRLPAMLRTWARQVGRRTRVAYGKVVLVLIRPALEVHGTVRHGAASSSVDGIEGRIDTSLPPMVPPGLIEKRPSDTSRVFYSSTARSPSEHDAGSLSDVGGIRRLSPVHRSVWEMLTSRGQLIGDLLRVATPAMSRMDLEQVLRDLEAAGFAQSVGTSWRRRE